jgi:glycosyltransferase involved in cell wall biosynthesis
MRSVVILPMYNEEDNAPLIVEHLEGVKNKFGLDLSVFAINDGSKDSTARVLADLQKKFPNLGVVSYAQNKGMGGAIREGIKKAIDEQFDVFIFMDSDMTHDGNDIPKFLAKIAEGYDLVLGSRFIQGGKMVGVPPMRVLISQVGNMVGKLLLWIPVRDFTTGYRAGKRAVFEKINLTETGFGIQLEGTVLAAAAGFHLGEVPIILTTRKFGDSKMNYTVKFILYYLTLLLKCTWLRHTKKF